MFGFLGTFLGTVMFWMGVIALTIAWILFFNMIDSRSDVYTESDGDA